MKNLFLLLCLVSSALCYNILCIFPAQTTSHDNLAKGVVNPLLKAGHKVTWVTPYEQKNIPKNLTIIDVSETKVFASKLQSAQAVKNSFATLREIARNLTIMASQNKELIRVVVEEQFDAVISVWMMNDYYGGYAAIQRVPWILLGTTNMHPLLEWLVDDIRSIPTTPLMGQHYENTMTFKSRLMNGLAYLGLSLDWWSDQDRQDEIYKSIFTPLAASKGVPLPPFAEVQRNVSILLLNSHESIAASAVKPPNVINIAGYHIDEEPSALPKDLQDILDKSPQGVVYFSMGSILRSSNVMTAETVTALLKKFGSLKQTVLWKFEQDIESQVPKNVHTRAWMPQQSILAHPNVRVFITHGGQLSSLEAIHYGVPLLAIPVFADQHGNADQAKNLGYALTAKYRPEMAEEIGEKLDMLLNNQTYYNRAKYLSKTFKARPEHPSKLISHYVELAIETKGAYHLRSLSLKYNFVERWMLDVVLLLSAAVFTVLTVLGYIVRTCYRTICGRRQDYTKKTN